MAPSRSTAPLYAVAAAAAVLSIGTCYSVVYHTYLDTSNPLVAHLPHPLHQSSWFANKRNFFNTVFVKRAWAWTTLVFLYQLAASPAASRDVRRARARLWRWFLATCVWFIFAVWFFGPSFRARVVTASGGQCIVQIAPPISTATDTSLTSGQALQPQILVVPAEYCVRKTTISTTEHPHLFADFMASAAGLSPEWQWKGQPKLTRGHDLSGHVFLLTLSILFLADDFTVLMADYGELEVKRFQTIAITLSSMIAALWYWMLLMTSVYFHTPAEKLSGFVMGLAAFLVTQIPYPFALPQLTSKISVSPAGVGSDSRKTN